MAGGVAAVLQPYPPEPLPRKDGKQTFSPHALNRMRALANLNAGGRGAREVQPAVGNGGSGAHRKFELYSHSPQNSSLQVWRFPRHGTRLLRRRGIDAYRPVMRYAPRSGLMQIAFLLPG